jgi:CO/xanthine dehydrogenase Mo-binding subunit
MSQQRDTSAPLKAVGRATHRIDALERVTGKAAYTNDIKLPGMLFGRILRSPHPHAKIKTHRCFQGIGGARRQNDSHS